MEATNLFTKKDGLKKFESFSIIDDLLATGALHHQLRKCLTQENKKVTGL